MSLKSELVRRRLFSLPSRPSSKSYPTGAVNSSSGSPLDHGATAAQTPLRLPPTSPPTCHGPTLLGRLAIPPPPTRPSRTPIRSHRRRRHPPPESSLSRASLWLPIPPPAHSRLDRPPCPLQSGPPSLRTSSGLKPRQPRYDEELPSRPRTLQRGLQRVKQSC